MSKWMRNIRHGENAPKKLDEVVDEIVDEEILDDELDLEDEE